MGILYYRQYVYCYRMRVILLEKNRNLGSIGDIVEVKDGYGRNFLIPKGKALRATPKNLEYFENKKDEYTQKNENARQDAVDLCGKIDGISLEILTAAQTNGRLYGSVTVRDLAERLLAEKEVRVSRSKIDLSTPITEVGVYEVTITPHPEVSCTIKIVVGRTHEEIQLLLGNTEGVAQS